LTRHRENIAFARLIGQRYLYSDKKMAASLETAKNEDRAWRPLENDFDQSRNSPGARMVILDTGQTDFLQPLANRLVAVVCRDNQWIWLIDSWMERYGGSLEDKNTPIPVRIRDGQSGESELMPLTGAVLYLDGASAKRDQDAIRAYVRAGKSVWTPFEISDTPTETLPRDRSIWIALEGAKTGSPSSAAVDARSGVAAVTVQMREPKRRTSQRFAFDVDALEPALAVLPTIAVPGWKATLDGRRIDLFSSGPSLVSVVLPQGSHHLVFFWKMPVRDRILAALGITAFAAFALLWLLSAAGDLVLRRSLRGTLRAKGSR
jgi:hypothetical protein